jgi:hypothetical protein
MDTEEILKKAGRKSEKGMAGVIQTFTGPIFCSSPFRTFFLLFSDFLPCPLL